MDAKKRWIRLRAAARTVHPIDELHERARIRLTSTAAPVITHVESASELHSLPYHMQGDASLHTAENVAARSLLRTHKDVSGELQRWWAVAQRSMKKDGAGMQIEVLPKAEYVKAPSILPFAMAAVACTG